MGESTPAPRSAVYGWSFAALPSPRTPRLLACRELDHWETPDAGESRNVQHRLVLRQSVYSRLAGTRIPTTPWRQKSMVEKHGVRLTRDWIVIRGPFRICGRLERVRLSFSADRLPTGVRRTFVGRKGPSQCHCRCIVLGRPGVGSARRTSKEWWIRRGTAEQWIKEGKYALTGGRRSLFVGVQPWAQAAGSGRPSGAALPGWIFQL